MFVNLGDVKRMGQTGKGLNLLCTFTGPSAHNQNALKKEVSLKYVDNFFLRTLFITGMAYKKHGGGLSNGTLLPLQPNF